MDDNNTKNTTEPGGTASDNGRVSLTKETGNNNSYGRSAGQGNSYSGNAYGSASGQNNMYSGNAYGNASGQSNTYSGNAYGSASGQNNTYSGNAYGSASGQNNTYSGNAYGSASGQNNTYSGNAYGNASGQSSAYSGNTYSTYNSAFNNPYSSAGSPPLDEMGQPLKNRYGMKITFSILEILSCCLCNPVSLIFGILGCAFTSSANTNYKQGRAEEFKKNARLSAIMLWIGFAVDVVAIVIWLAVGLSSYYVGKAAVESGEIDSIRDYYRKYLYEEYGYTFGDDDYDKYYNNDDYYDDYYNYNYGEYSNGYDWDEDSYQYSDAAVVGEYWKFKWNGYSYELPLKVSQFLRPECKTDIEDTADYMVNAKQLDYLKIYDTEGEVLLAYLQVYNPMDNSCSMDDCMIIGISIWDPRVYGDNYIQSVEIVKGVGLGSTRNEVMNALGEPSYSGEKDGYLYDEWGFDENDDYKYLILDYVDDKVSDITIGYSGDYRVDSDETE